MSKTKVIKFKAAANVNGADWVCELEVDADEWDAMDEDERQQYAEEVMIDETGYEVWYEE